MSSAQHMKKLMSLREGLHVMMQCYRRQHFADRYWLMNTPEDTHLGREPTMRKFTKESAMYFCARTCVQTEHSEDAIIIK